jgi:ABC-type sulfate transport system substrate-binding protein
MCICASPGPKKHRPMGPKSRTWIREIAGAPRNREAGNSRHAQSSREGINRDRMRYNSQSQAASEDLKLKGEDPQIFSFKRLFIGEAWRALVHKKSSNWSSIKKGLNRDSNPRPVTIQNRYSDFRHIPEATIIPLDH